MVSITEQHSEFLLVALFLRKEFQIFVPVSNKGKPTFLLVPETSGNRSMGEPARSGLDASHRPGKGPRNPRRALDQQVLDGTDGIGGKSPWVVIPLLEADFSAFYLSKCGVTTLTSGPDRQTRHGGSKWDESLPKLDKSLASNK